MMHEQYWRDVDWWMVHDYEEKWSRWMIMNGGIMMMMNDNDEEWWWWYWMIMVRNTDGNGWLWPMIVKNDDY